MSWRKGAVNFVKIAIWLLISFGPTSIMIFLGGRANAAQGSWLFLISLIVATAVINLGRVEELLVGPLRLKLREQIQESQVLNEAVRKQSILVAKLLLSLVQRQGRLGGFPEAQKQDFLLEVLNGIGDLSTAERSEICRDWHMFVEYDIADSALGYSTTPEDASHAQIERWKSLKHLTPSPSSVEIRAFLHELNALSEEREQILQDLEFYQKNKRHRRPEFWLTHKYDASKRIRVGEAA